MREKLFLVLFGLSFGALTLWASKPFILPLFGPLPQGAEFESVEQLQRAMLRRDARDVKTDGSVSLRSIITPHHSDSIMYDLLPNQRVKFQEVDVRTNSCGMRGADIPIEKSPSTFRVAFLGDSFTFGWGVEEDKSFPSVTGAILQQFAQEGTDVEVLNFGVPGYSTFQEVALFEEKGIDFRPDAVVLFFIENDFGLPFFIKNVHQKGGVVSGTSFARASWKGDDEQIDAQRRELDSKLNPNRSIARLARLGKKRGFDVYLAINPRPEWREDYKRLRTSRHAQNLYHLPLRSRFLRLVKARNIEPKSLSLPTDPHPSNIKHRLLGEILASDLLPALRSFEASCADCKEEA